MIKTSFDLRKKPRIGESVIQALLFFAGILSVFITLAIVYELGKEAWLFFGTPEVTLAKFFGGTKWSPGIGQFGIWPLVTSTLVTSAIAMLVSLPLGLSAALYLSEYASLRARSTLKPILEILAGIPTVVYGYFALLFMTPLLQKIFGEQVQVYNMASAGIVMGIMFLPLISPVTLGWPYLLASLMIGFFLLLLPGFQLYQSKESRQAARLFDRASYYPIAQLALIAVFILF